jgi:hypothetical protein
MITFVAAILAFSLIFIFSPSDDMTLPSKGAINSEIKHDNFRIRAMRTCKACNPILKDARGATVPCGQKMLGYGADHKEFSYSFSHRSLKFDDKDHLITSDHKTDCEYINLFGKQIGAVPRA